MKYSVILLILLFMTSCRNPEKVLYQELTPDEFTRRLEKCPVAYLPLGTLEWHSTHLPLGSDGLQSKGFFKKLATEAGGIVMSMLFIGPDGYDTLINGHEYYGMDSASVFSDDDGANETSIMMYLYPDLVKMDNLPADPAVWPLGMLGKDPRIHASSKHGKDIIEFEIRKMKAIIEKELLKL